MRRPRLSARAGVAAAAIAAFVALPGAVAADDTMSPVPSSRGCERRFEEAQRTDMESFRDYDRETWRNVHTEDAVSIFPSGAVVQGRDAIVDALASHFDDEEAIFTWTERLRTVNGCRTAYILYDTVYEIPSIGYRQAARTGVSYTFEGGRWLVVADQGTAVPG